MQPRCLIVAPHPDDETIGTGNWMDRHRDTDITVLHLTDGSPLDLSDARAARFRSRKAYALARRRELRAALALVNISADRMRCFGYIDRECHLNLPELIARLAGLVEDLKPEVVLSPSYEGGHPDHDSAALAVAAVRRRVSKPFRHREYRLYHADHTGAMATHQFLPDSAAPVEIHSLSPAEQDTKRRMIERFKSQQKILKEFAVTDERFREAPLYDFTRPPHEGMLLYERWGWKMTGAEWRKHALAALLS